MTAHQPIRTAERQSLIDAARNAQWELLQKAAELEIRLAKRLHGAGRQVPPTLGAKLAAAADGKAVPKKYQPLLDARNILGHALIMVVERDGQLLIAFEVADSCCGRNALLLDRERFLAWKKDTCAHFAGAMTDFATETPTAVQAAKSSPTRDVGR